MRDLADLQSNDQSQLNMSQLSVIEPTSSQGCLPNINNSTELSVFDHSPSRIMSSGSMHVFNQLENSQNLNLEQIMLAKKRRQNVPGYEQIKSSHKVKSFFDRSLKRKRELTSLDSNVSQLKEEVVSSNTKVSESKKSPVKQQNVGKKSKQERKSVETDHKLQSAHYGTMQTYEDSDSCYSEESNHKKGQRYVPLKTNCSPFSKHNVISQACSPLNISTGSRNGSHSPTSPVIKSLNHLR